MRKAPLYLLSLALLLLMAGGQLLSPPRERSDMENRPLAQAPAFSWGALESGRFSEDFEAFTADQSPLRDPLIAVNALYNAAQGKALQNGVLLGAGGRLFDRSDGWSLRNVRLNAQALETLARKTGLPVYLLLSPSAGLIYQEALPAHAPVADEEALLAAAAGEGVRTIPVAQALTAAKAAGAFFRTDHHWTLAGAQAAYGELCQALGLSPLPFENIRESQGFYGSFYARAPLPWLKGDTLSFSDPEGVRLFIDGEEMPALYNAAALQGRDQYAALLYGNHGLLTLENPAAPQGALLVIKDSFANLLLPQLARHYRRVVAVDPRYFTGDILATCKESEASQILCLYGLSTFSQGRQLALLPGL